MTTTHYPLILLVTLCLGAGISGCAKPTIDTSSEISLATSLAKMQVRLNKQERQELDDALVVVAFKGIHDANIMDLIKDPGAILPEARAALDGKTAQQIVSRARRIKQQRGETSAKGAP